MTQVSLEELVSKETRDVREKALPKLPEERRAATPWHSILQYFAVLHVAAAARPNRIRV